MLAGWMSHTVAEIKDCVDAKGYAHVNKLLKIGKPWHIGKIDLLDDASGFLHDSIYKH